MSAPTVTGRVLVDLTTSFSSARSVGFFPAGVTVEIRVADPVDLITVQDLRAFGPNLRYLVVGTDAEHVAGWVRALRGQAPVNPWVGGADL